MAKKFQNGKTIGWLGIMLAIFAALAFWLTNPSVVENPTATPTATQQMAAPTQTATLQPSQSPAAPTAIPAESSGGLTVYFLPVGKADAIILQSKGQTMVIDAGEAVTKEYVAESLRGLGVERIDILVASHPHADHIGGMQYLVEEFEIGKVYMPGFVAQTRLFEKLVVAMQTKGLQADVPEPGDRIQFGDAICTVLAPNSVEYKDENNYSIVLKVEIGERSLLLTGDAESASEKEMLAAFDVSAEVLKVAHHGSNSSSSKKFLEKVSPRIAIICCDEASEPKHPSDKVLKRLEERNVTVYRTDFDGPIRLYTDGQNDWEVNTHWEQVTQP